MNTQNHFKENRKQLMVLTTLITLLVPKSSTSGRFSVWEETVPPLAGPPPHVHTDEEVFYVLDGAFEFMLNGALIPAKPGSVIHVPSNELHTYKNTGDGAGKLLTIVTPGRLEDYFHAVGKAVHSVEDIPNLDTVPDFATLDAEQFIALAPEYEVAFHM